MNHLVLSCSLSPKSRSAILAQNLAGAIKKCGESAELVDLRGVEMPFCDAAGCYGHPNVVKLKEQIAASASVTIGVPIYNFGVGGAAPNMLALTGDVWKNKIVGFVCAAGGQGSYMAVMGLANSLMLDFRCVIVPRFVYTTGQAFTDGQLTDDGVAKRIGELASELKRFSGALPGFEGE